MLKVSMEAQLSDVSGPRISDENFSTNFLIHKDVAFNGSNFDKTIENTGANFIRYPGGTVTEEYFDLGNPNRETSVNALDELSGVNNPRIREIEPLDDFLDFCDEKELKAVIVLPTYKYFDQETREISSQGKAEIRKFVRELFAGAYGDAEIFALEIGNEWYQEKFNWSAEEFGQLQFEVAKIIDQEIQNTAGFHDLKILVQGARKKYENEDLSEFFENFDGESEIGVNTHFYGADPHADPLAIGPFIETRLREIRETWGKYLDNDFYISVTEWNVGDNGPDDTSVSGLMRLAPLMRMYVEMLEGGASLLSLWSAETYGPSGLTTTKGHFDGLTLTGYFFQLTSDALRGMSHNSFEEIEEQFLEAANGDRLGYKFQFDSNDKTVLYLVSSSDKNMGVDLNLSNVITNGSYVTIVRIGNYGDDAVDDFWTESAVYVDKTYAPITLNDMDDLLTIELGAYELVQVTVWQGTGAKISGDIYHSIDDEILGTEHDDVLNGYDGDDFIQSFHGDDRIFGGAGNDKLDGGAGNDLISPGVGSDEIKGGNGFDFISYEGSSSSVSVFLSFGETEAKGFKDSFVNIEGIIGSDFSDVLSGDFENNSIFGRGGDDTIRGFSGTSNKLYGEDGDDVILLELSGGFASGGNGNDFLMGGTLGVYFDGGAGDDWIRGSVQDDFLVGGEGDDIFIGSGGADIFNFSDNFGNDVISDFDASEDQIQFDLDGVPISNLIVSEVENDLILSVGDSSVTLESVDLLSFSESIFSWL